MTPVNWNRKELKANGKVLFKRNYVNAVIVCFIIAILVVGYSAFPNQPADTAQITVNYASPQLTSGIKDVLEEAEVIEKAVIPETLGFIDTLKDRLKIENATKGAIATIINNSGASNSFVVGILNTLNRFVFKGRFLEGTIMAVATALAFGFWMFVQNILLVGEYRFFLENKSYDQTNVSRLFFAYQIKRTLHIAWVMLLRFVFNALWYLTIVGGFVKTYAYRMIPFILAENPNISRKDAFRLSQEMMKGNKWKAFKLDLSFIGWRFLSAITFDILGLLYVEPYYCATNAELYFTLRQNEIAKQTELSKLFNDVYLTNPPADSALHDYPDDLFSIPKAERKKELEISYKRDYSISSLILIFFSMCFVGWIWEVFLRLLSTGQFVNRGTLMGPWLPIYGTGSVLILIFLKKLIDKPGAFFAGTFILCGILEYFTSWALEKLFHQRWWDYSNVFFNINGRVSLEGLLFFALGGSLVAYFLAPIVDALAARLSKRTVLAVCSTLIVLFTTDVVLSAVNPNQGEGISAPAAFISNTQEEPTG